MSDLRVLGLVKDLNKGLLTDTGKQKIVAFFIQTGPRLYSLVHSIAKGIKSCGCLKKSSEHLFICFLVYGRFNKSSFFPIDLTLLGQSIIISFHNK